jgi:phosphatidylserine/phosphatidylglycerophosphate/cardiolipin synthase-like enzyme
MLKKDWDKNLLFKKIERGYVRARLFNILLALVFISAGLAIYHSFKTMPAGLDYASPSYTVNMSDLKFLSDLTYSDSAGQRQQEQAIFKTIFERIDNAQQYILLDMFLWNDFKPRGQTAAVSLSQTLTDKLLAKKATNPDIRIDVITDPINTVYGGMKSAQLESLKQVGINVIITKLGPLRDSNPIYSGPWRLLFGWWGNSAKHGWLPNPFNQGGDRVSLRSYLAMLNFKANHRKVFLADRQGELVSIITSANPHDMSAPNSNVALEVGGVFGQEIYNSENAVAKMSGNSLSPLPDNLLRESPGANDYGQARLLTENQIRLAFLNKINQLNQGDRLAIAMFYLGERRVIKAILDAAGRGADIKIILDPSKDAFGYSKDGIPNREVAEELFNKSQGKIQIRLYATTGEQFHTKLVLMKNLADNTTGLFLGSANLTKRNLADYNLETDVELVTKTGLGVAGDAEQYFSDLWNNAGGRAYTVPREQYRDGSLWKYWLYRLQEASGLSSF